MVGFSGDTYGSAWHYYRWNGGWRYLYFDGLRLSDGNEIDYGRPRLYYVHGRWYSTFLQRFLSPNEKGDYLYGGDGPCVQDAVNCVWMSFQASATNGFQFGIGATYQLATDLTFNIVPALLGNDSQSPSEAFNNGRIIGRGVAQGLSYIIEANGYLDIGTGAGIGGLSITCEVVSIGVCTPAAALGGGTSAGLVTVGLGEVAYGESIRQHTQNQFHFANSSGNNEGRRQQPTSKSQSQIWRDLKSYRGGIKKSGFGKDTRYYTWDALHGEIDVFDREGNHLGVIDATTGDWIKDAVPGRNIRDKLK